MVQKSESANVRRIRRFGNLFTMSKVNQEKSGEKTLADKMRETAEVARVAKQLEYQGKAKEAYDAIIKKIEAVSRNGANFVRCEIFFKGRETGVYIVKEVGEIVIQSLRLDGFEVPNRVSVNDKFIDVSWTEKVQR